MKTPRYILVIGFLLYAGCLCNQNGLCVDRPSERQALEYLKAIQNNQTNSSGKLLIPFLDAKSQSNVVVTISDYFGNGVLCPMKYSNTISNSNLFTQEQRTMIEDIFIKYKNYEGFTTNSGPVGTRLLSLRQTNIIVPFFHRTNEMWQSRFQYTNSAGCEQEIIGSHAFSAKYRDKRGSGYNIWIGDIGGGSMLQFSQVSRHTVNGIYLELDNNGTSADLLKNPFADRLAEYRKYTNGMVIGKYLAWRPESGNLILEADFKKPYNLEKHRIDMQMFQR